MCIPFLNKYTRYFTGGEINAINNRTFIILGAALETVIVIIFLNIALKRKKQLIEVQPDIEKYLSIIMVGIPFSILGVSKTLWLANRFAKFFFVFLIVLIPALLSQRKIKFKGVFIGKKYLFAQGNRFFIVFILLVWNIMYSVLMLDNNSFEIRTLLNMT